jgi:hypothetical protein
MTERDTTTQRIVCHSLGFKRVYLPKEMRKRNRIRSSMCAYIQKQLILFHKLGTPIHQRTFKQSVFGIVFQIHLWQNVYLSLVQKHQLVVIVVGCAGVIVFG